MVVMWFPLKAIISRERHCANSLGKVVKLQSEKKATLSLWRREISDGNVEIGFPERSRISRVSKRERISLGNSVSPDGILTLLAPLYRPALRPSRV